MALSAFMGSWPDGILANTLSSRHCCSRALGFSTMKSGARLPNGLGRKEGLMNDAQLFARIATLFDVGVLGEARVLVAGCGSGGGQVALQLAMTGIGKFTLFDRDVLEAENVIRHVCGRRYIG